MTECKCKVGEKINLFPSQKKRRCLYSRGCVNSNKYGIVKCGTISQHNLKVLTRPYVNRYKKNMALMRNVHDKGLAFCNQLRKTSVDQLLKLKLVHIGRKAPLLNTVHGRNRVKLVFHS